MRGVVLWLSDLLTEVSTNTRSTLSLSKMWTLHYLILNYNRVCTSSLYCDYLTLDLPYLTSDLLYLTLLWPCIFLSLPRHTLHHLIVVLTYFTWPYTFAFLLAYLILRVHTTDRVLPGFVMLGNAVQAMYAASYSASHRPGVAGSVGQSNRLVRLATWIGRQSTASYSRGSESFIGGWLNNEWKYISL